MSQSFTDCDEIRGYLMVNVLKKFSRLSCQENSCKITRNYHTVLLQIYHFNDNLWYRNTQHMGHKEVRASKQLPVLKDVEMEQQLRSG
jgi:hypothetical protein